MIPMPDGLPTMPRHDAAQIAQRAEVCLLIVDDSGFIRLMLTRLLARLGYTQARLASDGLEALKLVAAGQVNCVISDVRMQPLNGLQMLQQIRAGDTMADRGLPFLLVTGNADEVVVKTAALLDASSVLAKPFTVNALEQHLNRALTARPRLRSPSAYRQVQVPVERTGSGSWGPSPAWTLRNRPSQGADRHGPRPVPAAEKPASRAAAESSEPLPQRQRQRVPVAVLEVGAVLAETIVSSTGVILLTEGVALTPRLIDKLQRLSSREPAVREVCVFVDEPAADQPVAVATVQTGASP